MTPTLKPKQHVVLLRMSALRSLCPSVLEAKFERGDVVTLRHPHNEGLLLKRIVALEKDRVSIKEGLLFVNGLAVVEPYAHHRSARLREIDRWPMDVGQHDLTIPPGMVFVLGDNRSESVDSRTWGPVPMSDIVGKAILTLP